jgi:hypothetical protein
MDVKRLRLSAIDDPAFVTAVEAAAAEADSAPELEQLLRSRGWPVEVVESADTASVGQPAMDVRRLDAAATSHS